MISTKTHPFIQCTEQQTKVILCYFITVIMCCLSFLSLTLPVKFSMILCPQNPVFPGMRWPSNTAVL